MQNSINITFTTQCSAQWNKGRKFDPNLHVCVYVIVCMYVYVYPFMHVPLNSAELCMVEKQIGSNEVAAAALPLPLPQLRCPAESLLSSSQIN